jgi:hypothetical protein
MLLQRDMMPFDAERHEPLQNMPWNPTRAHGAICAIVADLEANFDRDRLWPVHPLDEEPPLVTSHKTLYLGAAGTLWALWYLAPAAAVALRWAPQDCIGSVLDAYRATPDTGEVVPSYYVGEAGVLLVHFRLTGSRAAADRLWACVAENTSNPTNDALWGAAGTMVGAWHMHRWTGEQRWRDLFLANVEQLWRQWLPSPHAACHLWTQDLPGSVVQLLGAGHGFAGNMYPLLRGAALLSAERREQLYDRCIEALRVTAVIKGDAANWPPGVGPSRSDRTKMLLQWCHGAPGIITAANDFPPGRSSEIDDLLIKAGETIWRAGPLLKGPGVCHGTAGNGYAFLKLYRRTGDPRWLARARAFAMHAIGQSERMRLEYGRGRYALWTGDPGVAVYVWHCLKACDDVAGLDMLD